MEALLPHGTRRQVHRSSCSIETAVGSSVERARRLPIDRDRSSTSEAVETGKGTRPEQLKPEHGTRRPGRPVAARSEPSRRAATDDVPATINSSSRSRLESTIRRRADEVAAARPGGAGATEAMDHQHHQGPSSQPHQPLEIT